MLDRVFGFEGIEPVKGIGGLRRMDLFWVVWQGKVTSRAGSIL